MNVQGTAERMYLNKVAVCNFEIGYSIKIEDNIACVTDNDGVLIIDIENPKSPKKIGRIESSEASFGLHVKNNIVYQAASSDGLIIANISNPEQPEVIGQFDNGKSVYRVDIKGDYCYLGYSDSTVDILNLTDITNPVFVKVLSNQKWDGIHVHEDLLFGAAPNSGLVIYNVSDPVNPVHIKTVAAIGAKSISINENLLFLGCHWYGVKVINITNPVTAAVLSSASEDDGGEALGVVYAAGFMCVADNWGVEIFNVTPPTRIIKEDEFRRGIGAAHAIAAQGNFLFVAKGHGLGVFEISASKRIYFPPYLYYVIPISVVIVAGISFLIFRKIKKRKIVSS